MHVVALGINVVTGEHRFESEPLSGERAFSGAHLPREQTPRSAHARQDFQRLGNANAAHRRSVQLTDQTEIAEERRVAVVVETHFGAGMDHESHGDPGNVRSVGHLQLGPVMTLHGLDADSGDVEGDPPRGSPNLRRREAPRDQICLHLAAANDRGTGATGDRFCVAQVVECCMSDQHEVHVVKVLGLHRGAGVVVQEGIDEDALFPAGEDLVRRDPQKADSRSRVGALLVLEGLLQRLDQPHHRLIVGRGDVQLSAGGDDGPVDHLDLRPPAALHILEHGGRRPGGAPE